MENQREIIDQIGPDRYLIGVEPQCKGIEFEMTLNLTYQEFEDIVKLKYPGIHLSDKPGSIDRHFVFNVMEGDITIISYDKSTHVKGIILDHGGKGEWGPLFVKRFETLYPVPIEEKKEPERTPESAQLSKIDLLCIKWASRRFIPYKTMKEFLNDFGHPWISHDQFKEALCDAGKRGLIYKEKPHGHWKVKTAT